MSLEVMENSDAHLVEVTMSGKLTDQDYKTFVPRVEEMINRSGPLKMLLDMHDLKGWEPAAVWDDLKFGTKHSKDIARLAVVGSKRWQAWATKMCAAFMRAPVHFFEQGQREQALAWLAK